MTAAERFWAKVDTSAGPEGCWPWTAARRREGYGHFAGGPGLSYAHRFSYWLATGQHPGDLLVRHTCDNPPCVNPAHLELGTIADNMADRHNRGRDARGERINHAKLTDADVLSIRHRFEQGESHSDLAAAFGVSRSNVCRIVNGRTWSHVGAPAEAGDAA